MPDAPEWRPIEIASKTAHSTPGSALITIRWEMSAAPDPDWTNAFESAPWAKNGSGAYALAPGKAAARGPRLLEWTVPESDIEDAVKVVQEAIDHANALYPAVLEHRRQKAIQAQEQKDTEKLRLERIQEKLDEL
jgi:hypothetical protein